MENLCIHLNNFTFLMLCNYNPFIWTTTIPSSPKVRPNALALFKFIKGWMLKCEYSRLTLDLRENREREKTFLNVFYSKGAQLFYKLQFFSRHKSWVAICQKTKIENKNFGGSLNSIGRRTRWVFNVGNGVGLRPKIAFLPSERPHWFFSLYGPGVQTSLLNLKILSKIFGRSFWHFH